MNQTPYYFGSHYSNPVYVAHYLMRIFPYANIIIEIQGERFDDPDRLFLSVGGAFANSSTSECDVRELCPEFFYLPEMFQNINRFNLTMTEEIGEKQQEIDNVFLPKWSNGSPFNFTKTMRELLENEKVNSNIPEWINLIFGCYQRGEGAKHAKNIFLRNTYIGAIKIDKVTNRDTRDSLMRLVEMGMTPMQSLVEAAKSKNSIKNVKGNAQAQPEFLKLCECNTLVHLLTKSKNYAYLGYTFCQDPDYSNTQMIEQENEDIKIIRIKNIGKNTLLLLSDRNFVYTIKYIISDSEFKIVSESKPIPITSHNSKYLINLNITSLEDIPCIVTSDGRFILRGGFWDGRIEFINLDYDKKGEIKVENIRTESKFYHDYTPVTVLSISYDNKYIAIGRKSGVVNILSLEKDELILARNFYNHSEEVTSIYICSLLNLIATTSEDGYINIYTIPTYHYVRSIRIDKSYQYPIKIFLSISPLPTVVIYTLNNYFITYSINGKFINKIYEKVDHLSQINQYDCKNDKNNQDIIDDNLNVDFDSFDDTVSDLNDPKVFRSKNFEDFLLYSNNKGQIKIRSFPYMELVSSYTLDNEINLSHLDIIMDNKFCVALGELGELHIFRAKRKTKINK